MAIDWDDYFATLPEARRRAIKARAAELIAEESSLAELRKDLEESQVALAKKMGVKQADVSKIERRSDMHISTLRKYVEAVGGSLEIVVRVPGKPPRRLTFNAQRAGSIESPPGAKVIDGEELPAGVTSGARPGPSKTAKAAAMKGPAAKKAAKKKAAGAPSARPRTKRPGTI